MASWDLVEIGDLSLAISSPLSPIPLLLQVSISVTYLVLVLIFRFFIFFSFSSLNYLFVVDWRTVLLDMRNHGKSADRKLNPPHTMDNAAKDLADLVKAEGWPWPDVVIGHSMGGKVALQFAETCSRGDYGHSASLPKQVFFLCSYFSIV